MLSKSIYELIKEIQDYFKYRKPLHLSFGRKITPTYIVNQVPKLERLDDSTVVTQNVYHEVCHLYNVKVKSVFVEMQTAQETLKVRITIDGTTFEDTSIAGVSGTPYYIKFGIASNNFQIADDTTPQGFNASYGEGTFCRDIKVESTKSTANGANALVTCVLYNQY